MRRDTRSFRARRRTLRRLEVRRRLPLEILETRKVLSANGVPSNPLEGLSPELYLASDSRLHTYEMYDRDVFQNSDFAADIRELELHRGNELDPYTPYPNTPGVEYHDRIPDLETAKIEYGPEASNYGDWYSDYNVPWPITPSPAIFPRTSAYSRDGMDPEGTYTPYTPYPTGGDDDTWGRMADDYDFTQWFFTSESIQGLFPQVEGWHADLNTFVPGSPGNSTVVTSGTISFTDTSDPSVTIDYSIPWTLTVTQTLSGTQWTYEEQLVLTGYDVVSTWDFDYTPYGYEIPDPQDGYGIEQGYGDPYGGGLFDTALNSGGPPPTGQPGHVHRVLHQSGNYNFTFFAGGDDQATESYSLTDEYDDSYVDSYEETFDPATLPFETEHHTYVYEAVVDRQQDDHLLVLVGDPDPYGGGSISDYNESGNLTYNGVFHGDIDSEHHLHVTGEESSHIDLDETSTLTEDLVRDYSVTYVGLGELHEDYYSNSYKVGTRQEDGTQTEDLDTFHTGSFTYSDRLDHMTSNNYDSVTLRTEDWDETLTYDSADTIDREIEFLSSGNQLVTSTGSGSKTVDYWTEGNHTLNWFDHSEGGGFFRDSTFHETRRDHSDPVHHIAAEIAPATAITGRVDTNYSEDLVRQIDSYGNVVSKTGTFNEDGDAWLVRRLDFDGDWDVNGSGGDANWVIDTQDQQDYWNESLTDYYRFIFDDVTTHNANGTSTTVIDEEGEADGDWRISEEGYYDWAAHSDSQHWTVEKTEFYGNSPGSVGGLTLREWLQQTSDPWTNPTWWGQGAATRSDDWVYWYSDETTVDKSAGGSITGRVGTVLTNIADPDSDDDTIDGGTTRTPTQTTVHETNSQTGDRSEFVWNTYDYEYDDPFSPTLITYYNEQFSEWDEGYQITLANSQAVFDPSGSRHYTVDEEGFTFSNVDYDYLYENWWYSGGGHERVEGTSYTDRDATWNYDDHYHTDVTALGEVLDSGTLHDWGLSTITTEDDWFFESYYSGSGGFDHWTYDGHGLATGSVDYDYTTTISSEPDPYGGSMTTASVTGEQTDSQATDWNEDVTYSWMYTYDYGNGPESYGDTETYSHGGNWSDSQTYTNEEFYGPRSGRERKFGWLLELFGFWD